MPKAPLLLAVLVLILLSVMGSETRSHHQDGGEQQEKKPIFLGPRTVVYYVSDLEQATEWYTKALGFGPYFKEEYYVGFNVEGSELGLIPGGNPPKPSEHMAVAYWGVEDIAKAIERLKELGATVRTDVLEVGVKVATLVDPFGNVIGLVENPWFPNTAKPLKADGSNAG